MRLSATRYGITLFPRRTLATAASTPTRTLQYVRQFKRETRDPAWSILDHLHSPTPTKGNAERALPIAHREWDFLLRTDDIQGCLEALRTRGIALESVPFWGLAEMVAFNVRRVSHTETMLEVAQARVPEEPAGPLLVFAMLHLARFDLVYAYPGVVSSFLRSAHTHPDLHYNLFLQSLCLSTHPSEDAARSAVRVLRAMDDRGVKLRPEMYDTLLRNRFVTLELTKYLHDRMVREGHVPTQAQLESFLRVFAHQGAIHDRATYEKTVKPLLTQNRRALRHSPQPALINLASQDTGVHAFAYLKKLVDKDQHKQTVNIAHLRQDLIRRHPHVDHPRPGAAEATTVLQALARDRTVGTQQLMRAYTSLRHMHPLRQETLATRTALITALLHRRAYATALQFAQRLLRAGLPLDARALSAVLQAHALAGQPHTALDVLEAHAARQTAALPALHPSPRRPVRVTTAAMNGFLAALLAAGRPDVLFQLTDAMEALYDVRPDTRTLVLMLRGAVRATRLDNTLRGALAALRRRLHLGAPIPEPPRTRADALARVRGVAAERYRSGVWRGAAAAETARRVFIGALLGQEGERVAGVEAPAIAVRPHRDADSLLLFGAQGRPLTTADVAGDALPWPPGAEPDVAAPKITARSGPIPAHDARLRQRSRLRKSTHLRQRIHLPQPSHFRP
ncbi:hypothetical protein BD626DRAFT_35875 [Schizophyllum amplum]|uniref:Pentacotripeptide-repeat region of PRORP domain-containing protein n=1 Tax=Schizophyllum amplum TaxID=97359 RepID=A0A550CEP7_9AGAR|nr:hypothetical protein BD626DRAFT_35875 [Auriculariopsis ampla]